MNKKLLLITGIIFLTAVVLPLLIAQPENIIIDNPDIYIKKQRPPVKFPHELHMGSVESCKDCHHNYKNGENILNEEELAGGKMLLHCSDCHLGKRYGNKYILRDAYHTQCAGCHRKLAKEGKETGPRLCGQCHPRN